MRAFLLTLLLALPALPARSQALPPNWKAVGASTWGGIDARNDSSLINDADAQDAANVITDNGYLEKRPGNVRIATILSGYGVKLVREWVAPSQTRYLIAHSSDAIFQTDLSGTPVEVSTVTHGQNVSIAAAFSKLYVADGSNALWYWDGTSTGSVAGAPICNLIEFANERIYCGNIPSESSSRVRVSSFGGAGYWTIPSNVATIADAPNEFDFQKDDGEAINCMKATPWGLFIGKRHSTHILKGYDNLTYYKRVIDPNVGCVDSRTVQIVNGQIIWLALDGIYSFNGTGQPVLLTRDLDPLIKQIRQLNSTVAEWITDITPDWQAGLVNDNGRTWDSATIPGSIIPSSTTFTDNTTSSYLSAPTLVNLSTQTANSLTENVSTNVAQGGDFSVATEWTAGNSGGGATASAKINNGDTFTCNGSAVTINCPQNAAGGTASSCGGFYTDASGTTCTSLSGTQSFYISVYNGDGTGESTSNMFTGFNTVADLTRALPTTSSSTYVCFQNQGNSGCSHAKQFGFVYLQEAHPTNIGWNLMLDTRGTCTQVGGHACYTQTVANVRVSSYAATATYISPTFDTSFSTPILSAFNVSLTSNTHQAITYKEARSSDAVSWSTTTITNGAVATKGKRYWRYEADFTTDSGTKTATHSGTTSPLVAIETGTWDSPVHFIGSAISAWKQFNATDLGDGAIAYDVRGASYAFSQSATTPPWTFQPNNTIIDVSTNTYFQYRIDSSSVTSSTQTEQIDRVAVNWQEGGNFPMASGYLDRRYYLCVELSTTAATNDTCLVMQKNGKWVKWTGPSIGALGIYNTDLVMGSAGTDSHVWKVMQSGVYSDDGDPINAYWITKDFTDGLAFNNKVLHEMWVDAQSVVSSSITVSYATDKGSSFVDKTVPIDGSNSTFSINKRIDLDDGFSSSKYFRFKFGSDTSTDYFRLNDYVGYLEDRPRTTE